jgi:hypothetical protein
MDLRKNKKNKKLFMKLSLSLLLCGLMEVVLEVDKMTTKFLISSTEFLEA